MNEKQIKQQENGQFSYMYIPQCREAKAVICSECGAKPSNMEEAQKYSYGQTWLSMLISTIRCPGCIKKFQEVQE